MRRFVAALVVLLVPREARAIDPFEIQVYDGTADEPGQFGSELHMNSVIEGRGDDHRTSRFTLEPSFGVLRNWELGAYLQSTLRRDGTFEYAGAKLRSKLVWGTKFRYGVNLEVSRDDQGWGGEVRPIVAYDGDGWAFAFNPIVNPVARTFEPAASLLKVFPRRVSFGVEFYASRHERYLYEVVNVLVWKKVEINFGVGEGLEHASNPFIAKSIVGYAF